MADSETGSEDVFDLDRIRRLVDLMQECDLSEIDLQQSDQRIRLKRGTEPESIVSTVPGTRPPSSSTATPARSSVAEAMPAPEGEHIVCIRSPMVGTFYARANPDAPPFVEVGDRVEPETTVCIVEAMKVFNEIKADVAGRIVEVLCENEDPVEFGKPMFKVDTGP